MRSFTSLVVLIVSLAVSCTGFGFEGKPPSLSTCNITYNPVEPFYCKYEGSLNKPFPFSTVVGPSFGYCRYSCFTNVTCKSFSYAGDSTCTLYNTTVEKQKPTKKTVTAEFWDLACYDIAEPIGNPSFETGSLSPWTPAGNATISAAGEGYYSKYAVDLSGSNSATINSVSQNFNLCQGINYTLEWALYPVSASSVGTTPPSVSVDLFSTPDPTYQPVHSTYTCTSSNCVFANNGGKTVLSFGKYRFLEKIFVANFTSQFTLRLAAVAGVGQSIAVRFDQVLLIPQL